MINTQRSAAFALLLSAAGLAVAPTASEAANGVPAATVGQHATVMNNIYRSQQRNNAAISHVQSNIRSSQPRTY